MLFTLCLYPCIGCYSLIGILKYLSIFPCQALSHILFHHTWYHNYCIIVIIQLHFNFQFFWTTFVFNLLYRLFRKDIFGAADEIELKFMDRFISKPIISFHNIDILQWWPIFSLFNRRNQEDMHLFSIILNQEIRKLSRQVCHFSLLEWTHLQRIFHQYAQLGYDIYGILISHDLLSHKVNLLNEIFERPFHFLFSYLFLCDCSRWNH